MDDAKYIAKVIYTSQEIDKDEDLVKRISDPVNTWGGRLISRLKDREFGFEISPSFAFGIDEFIKDWGDVAMYAAFLRYLATKKGVTKFEGIDLMWFTTYIPTDEERERLWRFQKIDLEDREKLHLFGDNILDFGTCYKSLVEPKVEEKKDGE